MADNSYDKQATANIEAPKRNSGLIFILLTLVVDALGIGIIVPVMPTLLTELLENGRVVSVEGQASVQGQTGGQQLQAVDAAPWSGYLSLVYAAMNFLFGPAIGNLSDRFGRRPILLFALFALALDYILMGFARTIEILFIGRLLSGICGATFSTANAYIADITPEEERARAFGLTGAAFGIGFVLGPVLGGLLGQLDPRAPFFAAAALAMLNFLYGWFVLPESLPVENRRPFQISRANPLGAFVHFWRLPALIPMFGCAFLYHFAHNVYPNVWSYHGEQRYNWEPFDIGMSLMAFGVMSTLVQGVLLGRIIKSWGTLWTGIAGFGFNVVAFIGFVFARDSWMLYCVIPIAGFGAIAGPAVSSIMSNRVGVDSQGDLQGALACVHGIANMISPIVMTQCFSFFLSEQAPFQFHGSAFLLAAVLTLLAMIPFWFGARRLTASDQATTAN